MLQNNTYQVGISNADLYKFVCKGAVILMVALFVFIDGLQVPETFTIKALTIPFFICSVAMLKNLHHALNNNHNMHAVLFICGLSTLAALT